MKIEKAIEIFEGYCRQETSPLAEDFITAVKLGIEALKRWKEARVKGTTLDYSLLPGETEE